MYRLAVILLALATAASCPALAAEVDTLSSIGAQLDHYAVLRSDFKQSKQMSALKRPLATSGHLVFSREHGILWQIEQPYRMTYVLGDDRIVEISADGTRRERGLRDLPGLTQMSKIFRAVFSANTAALRDVFEIGVRGDPAKWEIELKPRQAQIAQFLDGLQLSGGRFVEKIRISEVGGDTTLILFHNTQNYSALNETEVLLFGGILSKP